MSVSGERGHYEDPSLWSRDRFLGNARELERFATCADVMPKEVRSLLDIGAGNGAFLRYLEDRARAVELSGVERSETAISMRLCAAPIVLGSADALTFGAKEFDCASALEVFEHLPAGVYERAIDEIQRVASRYILLSVPYMERRKRVVCGYCSCEFNPNYHMRSFDEPTLAGIFSTFALEQLEVITREDHLLGMLGRRFWVVDNSKHQHRAICPQCGFRPSGISAPSTHRRVPVSNRVASSLKVVSPKRRVPVWAVALYRRRSG